MLLLAVIDGALDLFIPSPITLFSAHTLTQYHPLTTPIPFLDEGSKFLFVPPGFMSVRTGVEGLSLSVKGVHDGFSDIAYSLVNLFHGFD